MKWFGDTWGAPINETVEHTDTPVGEICLQCEEPILAGDRGVLIPHLAGSQSEHAPPMSWESRPWHIDCWCRSILGPVIVVARRP